MATEVKLPRLGQGMESGTIVRWLKAEGDRVEKGEPLYEVDTDKATQEVEAEASGVLLTIAVAEGEVPVGRDGRASSASPARRSPSAVRRLPAEPAPEAGAEPQPPASRRPTEPTTRRVPRRDQRRARARRRPRQGLAARAPDGARARRRARRPDRHRARTGAIVAEDVERASRPGAEPRRAQRRAGRAGARAARGRVGAADEHPHDDRPPPHRGLDRCPSSSSPSRST